MKGRDRGVGYPEMLSSGINLMVSTSTISKFKVKIMINIFHIIFGFWVFVLLYLGNLKN